MIHLRENSRHVTTVALWVGKCKHLGHLSPMHKDGVTGPKEMLIGMQRG